MLTALSKYQIIYFLKTAFFVIYHLLGHTNMVKQKNILNSFKTQRKRVTHPSNTNILFYSKGIFLWFLQGENPKWLKNKKEQKG